MTPGDGFLAPLKPLNRRVGFLSPFIAHPAARRVARALVWGFWAVYFLFIVLVLSLRYAILPHIESYRPGIERMVSDGLGRAVSIGRVEASWDGIHPNLALYDVSVADAEGRPALAFSRVETVLSWWSVAEMRLRLRLLRIGEPTLHIRRDGDGGLFIAGIPLVREGGGNGNGGGIAAWLLEQRRIRVDGATLIWKDDLRNAPELVMEDVNIALDNHGQRHRFGLTARSPREFASRVDARGDFIGADFGAPDAWRGQLFAEIGEADLAVWEHWVDYPATLSRGRGAARAWLTFAGGGLREATADVSLRDVDLRLAEDLPALDIESVSGRLRASFSAGGLSVKGQNFELLSRAAAREGKPAGGARPIRVEPVDFGFAWQKDRKSTSGAAVGSAEVSRADLDALSRLAAYLPFDSSLRQTLADCAPSGQVSALSARWSGDAEKTLTYALKADLRGMGARATGNFPGFSGITGTLEASETGGKVVLHSATSSIDLPMVFPEPLIQLDSLNLQASWKIERDGLEVELTRVDFAGPEAAGSARGSYRTAADGPGTIELTAALTRADARAVWRYMPHVVGQGARRWLRDSLLAGQATEARLTLNGNLKDFPFLDQRLGQFLVTVKARDVVLDYGAGWPRIDDIHGDLRFEGNGMSIEARQGRILGARLTDTWVRIPDFDAPVSTLFVKGQADGPSAEFLKFIDRSPVSEQIDHFTKNMSAAGNGQLNIDLTIPLDERKLKESRIAGVYRFIGNAVTVDAALPPLRQVNGSLRFSGSDLSIPEIDASLFGGTLKIKGDARDGRLSIAADGTADIGQLRRQSAHPLLNSLSGTVPYHGEIRIGGRHTDLVVESNLVGLTSTLPEPLAKAAGDALALRFEKRPLDANNANRATETVERELIDAALGTILSARLVRRKSAGGFTPERGAIAIGRPLWLPEKGLTLGISARYLDLDAWQKLFAATPADVPEAAASAWLPDAVNLRADELSVYGTAWSDVDLSATLAPKQWKIHVDSRQMKGDITWNGDGGGQLVARLARLIVERLPPPSATDAGWTTERLPALDIVADEFIVRQFNFGRLEVRASNDGAGWNLDHIEASNPHGVLIGKGTWQQEGSAGRTQLSFKLESDNVGRLLARMGYPGTVRAGTARLDGNLGWNGAPTEVDYASMRGDLKLAAAKGQFLKLDPGAAGKLLGLISLQNLPRRISLDFRDVFSAGLAFDVIAGKMTVLEGIMRTEQLRIDSPAARVSMRGEVDLARETQRLNVTVQPEVGDTAALGVAFVNPLAGAVTWVANKVLRNPLGTVFGYNYLITGGWDDPKVEKLGAPLPGETLPTETP
ncbi:MAG: TIGR02099 family protein [Candidatus Accumulibacter sp.]|jgi:uncharacterized protein (TIGR02099 family)|nr:TIGR02099 family protein [Accumulibacter sp.]